MPATSLQMSHCSRMSREAWAAGSGRPAVPEQLDSPSRSAGKQLSRGQASGREEAEVVSID